MIGTIASHLFAVMCGACLGVVVLCACQAGARAERNEINPYDPEAEL